MIDEDKPLDFMYEQVVKIMNSINADDNTTMINETDLLLKTLPEKFKEDYELIKLEKEIQKIFNDKDEMRILRIIQKIKIDGESCIEYYDIDKGQDHRLFYREELEKKFFNLQEKIRKALSVILKHKLIEEIDYG